MDTHAGFPSRNISYPYIQYFLRRMQQWPQWPQWPQRPCKPLVKFQDVECGLQVESPSSLRPSLLEKSSSDTTSLLSSVFLIHIGLYYLALDGVE